VIFIVLIEKGAGVDFYLIAGARDRDAVNVLLSALIRPTAPRRCPQKFMDAEAPAGYSPVVLSCR
jgi:hypothetical protein